jgi:hypothetical protein
MRHLNQFVAARPIAASDEQTLVGEATRDGLTQFVQFFQARPPAQVGPRLAHLDERSEHTRDGVALFRAQSLIG